MTLADINAGDLVEVIGYAFSAALSQRSKLLALGLTRKTVIEVINAAVLGDPLEIKVRGYHLSLRKDEAKCIKVKNI